MKEERGEDEGKEDHATDNKNNDMKKKKKKGRERNKSPYHEGGNRERRGRKAMKEGGRKVEKR